jgi:hypothetical protein
LKQGESGEERGRKKQREGKRAKGREGDKRGVRREKYELNKIYFFVSFTSHPNQDCSSSQNEICFLFRSPSLDFDCLL